MKPWLRFSLFTVALLGLCSLLLSCAAAGTTTDNTATRVEVQAPVGELGLQHQGWSLSRKRAERSSPVTFFVELRTGKEGEVEKLAARVSDPRSPSYGQFLSAEQLRAFVAAPKEVEDSVTQWLHDQSLANNEALSIRSYGDVLAVSTTAQNTERLFDTQIAEFTHTQTGRSLPLITQSATLPSDVGQHVRQVVGLAEATFPRRVTSVRLARRGDSTEYEKRQTDPVTPPSLRSHYNVSSSLSASASVSQAVVSFDDRFSTTALATFAALYNYTTPQITTVSGVGTNAPCQTTCYYSGESDLDVQYITAMGLQAKTYFHLNSNDQNAMYAWALQVANSASPAMVYSISWGLGELSTSGSQYSIINSTETQLAKLAARGISVLAASGDYGAAGDSQACPLDTSKYCFPGGCTHSSTSCGQIMAYSSAYGVWSFPSAVPSQLSASQINTVSTFLSNQLGWSGCKAGIEYDSNGGAWLYSNCSCSSLYYGTPVNSVQFYDFATSSSTWPKFINSYPATSAWVTSVGATEWPASGGETTASFEGLSAITTGGGFSAYFAQPSWQTTAVSTYLSSAAGSLPPSFTYEAGGRAFPDVSLVGHYYAVAYAGSTGTSSVQLIGVDGTSASTPSFAGLITLINQMRVSNGQSQLGFLNPLLYQMAADLPEAFTDITTGDNKATEGYVCQYGWSASSGWDPATGLGVPNFGIMAEYLANTTVPAFSPGPSPKAATSPTPGSASTQTSWLGLLRSSL